MTRSRDILLPTHEEGDEYAQEEDEQAGQYRTSYYTNLR